MNGKEIRKYLLETFCQISCLFSPNFEFPFLFPNQRYKLADIYSSLKWLWESCELDKRRIVFKEGELTNDEESGEIIRSERYGITEGVTLEINWRFYLPDFIFDDPKLNSTLRVTFLPSGFGRLSGLEIKIIYGNEEVISLYYRTRLGIFQLKRVSVLVEREELIEEGKKEKMAKRLTLVPKNPLNLKEWEGVGLNSQEGFNFLLSLSYELRKEPGYEWEEFRYEWKELRAVYKNQASFLECSPEIVPEVFHRLFVKKLEESLQRECQK